MNINYELTLNEVHNILIHHFTTAKPELKNYNSSLIAEYSADAQFFGGKHKFKFTFTHTPKEAIKPESTGERNVTLNL